jgi:hypothetical protein
LRPAADYGATSGCEAGGKEFEKLRRCMEMLEAELRELQAAFPGCGGRALPDRRRFEAVVSVCSAVYRHLLARLWQARRMPASSSSRSPSAWAGASPSSRGANPVSGGSIRRDGAVHRRLRQAVAWFLGIED